MHECISFVITENLRVTLLLVLKRHCVQWWKQTCIHSVSKCCMFIWVWHFNRHPGEVGEKKKQCIPMVTRTSCFIMFNMFSMFNIKHSRQKKISHLEKYSFLSKTIHEQWTWKALGSVLGDMKQKLLFFIFGSWQFILSFFPTPMNQMPPLFCPLYSSQQSTFRFTFSCAKLSKTRSY